MIFCGLPHFRQCTKKVANIPKAHSGRGNKCFTFNAVLSLERERGEGREGVRYREREREAERGREREREREI